MFVRTFGGLDKRFESTKLMTSIIVMTQFIKEVNQTSLQLQNLQIHVLAAVSHWVGGSDPP